MIVIESFSSCPLCKSIFIVLFLDRHKAIHINQHKNLSLYFKRHASIRLLPAITMMRVKCGFESLTHLVKEV